jgi:hypothetical protein
MGTGVRHIDRYKTELLLAGASAQATPWIDMQYYSHVTFFLFVNNSSSGTPAQSVSLLQALDTSGTSSSSVAFNTIFSCSGGFATQSSSADVWVSSSIASTAGSFTISSTVSTIFGYAIEVQDTDLNLNSAAKTVALSFGTAASTTIYVFAHCFPRFDGNYASMPTALT